MKKYLISFGVFLLLIGGFTLLLNSGGGDQPPTLSWNAQLSKGMLESGKQGFLEYSSNDESDYKDYIADYRDEYEDAELMRLSEGVNYVYPAEDISVEDLRHCIDPEADRVLFAQYDASEGYFLTYPKGPFGEDTIEIDDTDYVFKKGYGLVVIVRHSADSYCLVKGEEKSLVDVTVPMQDDVKGWVLLASNEENITDFIEPFKGRVERVWKMVDDGDFEKVDEADYGDNLEDHYLLWLKLAKKEVVVEGEGGDDPVSEVARYIPANPRANFEQISPGQSQISFSWDKVVDPKAEVTGYLVNVFYCDANGQNCNKDGYYAQNHRVNPNSPNYYLYNPDANKKFYFKVAAELKGREVVAEDFTAEVVVQVPAAVVAQDPASVDEAEVDVPVEDPADVPVEDSADVPADVPVDPVGGQVTNVVITALPNDINGLKNIQSAVSQNSDIAEGLLNNCLANLPCVVAANSGEGASTIIEAVTKAGGVADFAVAVMITDLGHASGGVRLARLASFLATKTQFSAEGLTELFAGPMPVTVVENYPLADAETLVSAIERLGAFATIVVEDPREDQVVVGDLIDEPEVVLPPLAPVNLRVDGYSGKVDMSWDFNGETEPDKFEVTYWLDGQGVAERTTKFVDFVPGQLSYGLSLNDSSVMVEQDGTRLFVVVKSVNSIGIKSEPLSLNFRLWILPFDNLRASFDPNDETKILYSFVSPNLDHFDYLEMDKYFLDIYVNGVVQSRIFYYPLEDGAWHEVTYPQGDAQNSVSVWYPVNWPSDFSYYNGNLSELDVEFRLHTQYKYKDGSNDFLVSNPDVEDFMARR